MLTDVESAILRLTQLIDLFGDLSANSNYAEVLLNRKDEKALKTAIEALKGQSHGEWIREIIVEEPRKNKRAYARCTECGVYFNHYKFAVLHFFFCPNCGADMRKGATSQKEGEAE